MTTALSQPQCRMLIGIRDHADPYWRVWGLSAHGGAHWTLQSLLRRGLAELSTEGTYVLTDAGREIIGEKRS